MTSETADAQAHATPAALHAAYSSLLEKLPLAPRHAADLHRRGLYASEVAALGYRSTPAGAELHGVDLHGVDLAGVPGFYQRAGRWQMVKTGAGYFIPCRDSRGHVRALLYRLDNPLKDEKGKVKAKYLWLSSSPDKYAGGTSSGTPLHWSNPGTIFTTGEALLTEGALKGDIIARAMGCGVVAVAGTACFGDDQLEELQREAPELRRVVVAFDADWRTNPHVRAALERLTRRLRAVGLAVTVRTWPDGEGKGLDDYLLACGVRTPDVQANADR